MKLSEDVGSIDISKLRLFANGRLYKVSGISYSDDDWFVSAENYINILNDKDGLYVGKDGEAGGLGRVIEIYAEVDLRSDCKPENHVFLDQEGEHEVISITPLGDNYWSIRFKDKNGEDSWNTRINGDTGGYGVLLRINRLKIYDEGKEIANPHDIIIRYNDLGNEIELVEVSGLYSTRDMVQRFGSDWLDEHYRESTPKVDLHGDTICVQVGACDYPYTDVTHFVVGKRYSKKDFMDGMEVVQEAARNLSRLRKEFGSKKKTIII